jgi:hypothetical protein
MSGLRVFVGYGYNARDRWIETHAIPLVDAFGCKVVHGKVAFGGSLPSEVFKLIQSSDAMIGFTTRREPVPGKADQFTTHPWVVQELTAALSQIPPVAFVEVREEGVVSPGGMIEAYNAQRIEYRESERADCLVQIAEAVGKFRSEISVTTVRLGPETAIDHISEHLDDGSFICRFRMLRGAIQSNPAEVPVLPGKGGLFVRLRGVQEGDLVQITISAGGRTWRSDYESLDTVDVQLKGKD